MRSGPRPAIAHAAARRRSRSCRADRVSSSLPLAAAVLGGIIAQSAHDMAVGGNNAASLFQRQGPPPTIGLALAEEGGGVPRTFDKPDRALLRLQAREAGCLDRHRDRRLAG